MVPCGWFPAAAAACRAAPEPADMGVHLTLTSEWDAYRWGPLTTTDPASGLLDREGYFHRLVAPVQLGAEPAAVGRELSGQIERALAAGIDVTHLDAHMFALYHSRLLPIYLELAFHYRVPALMVRDRARQPYLGAGDREALAALVEAAEARGMPLVDDVVALPLVAAEAPAGLPLGEDRLAYLARLLDGLPPGITCVLLHPARDTPELRAIAPDWQARVGDFELFAGDGWEDVVRDSGVDVIGFRALRDLMRQRLPQRLEER